MRSGRAHLRAQAMSAFESLMFVMILSLALLVPLVSLKVAGVMMITLGAVGAARALGHAVAAARGGSPAGSASLRRRLVLPIAAHLLIVWCGIRAATGKTGEEMLLLSATLWLLITATRGAWHLLVEVGEAA